MGPQWNPPGGTPSEQHWQEMLGPAGHPVALGQESPGQELLVRGHLPVHYVFRQDMFAAGVRVTVTIGSLPL